MQQLFSWSGFALMALMSLMAVQKTPYDSAGREMVNISHASNLALEQSTKAMNQESLKSLDQIQSMLGKKTHTN